MTGHRGPERPIIVGVDGSHFSRCALGWAIRAGRRLACPVVAMMVWQADSAAGSPPASELRGFLADTVQDVVAEVGGPEPSTRLVPGLAALRLVQASKRARLLVLASHGLGYQAPSMGVGSVADHCVREAACPVLIIPPRLVETTSGHHALAPAELLPDQYGLGPL